MSAMRVQRVFSTSLLLAVIACWPGNNLRAAQAAKGPAPAAQPFNVTKDILDHKDTLNWKPAPDSAIPADVCYMFQVCVGATKVIALPAATEGGTKVARGVFLTQDAKHADVLILERQTSADVYFFLLSPQGTLVKTAYAAVTGKSWLPMGMSLAQPTFDKDKVVWHTWASKLSTAAAEKKPESN
jgi:hypothetical protein